MPVFLPVDSTGWKEGLFGLSLTARFDCPAGWVVHDEWHLKHTSYSRVALVT